MTRFPPPRDIGLPQKFSSWRNNQEDAINEFLDCDRDYLAQCMPTGSGKSLTYVSDAVLSGMSTVILTSTKALQTQLLGDFAEIGMVEIKGKNAYRCVEDRYGRGCDYGDCNFGLMCDRQKSGCHYYDALASARTGKLVVTNYAYWLTMNRFAEGLKKPELLVMDEAHHAETHLAHTFSFHIRPKEIDSLLQMKIPTSLSHLSPWADKAWAAADTLYEHEKFEFQQRAAGDKDLLRKIKGLRDKLETLRKHVDDVDWLVELQDGIKFCPIWPKQYAKTTLFKNASKVLMTSATVRPKTVEMLGLAPIVGRGDQMSKAEVLMAQVGTDPSGPKTGFNCLFSDYPSIFDPERRLVMHIPTVRVNHHTTKEEYATWIKRIDQIITPRLHQKGIIHTVSYDRRNYVMEHSEHAEHMITHTTDSVVTAVAKFKKADPPAILVSPSVTTGFDFPHCVDPGTKVLKSDLTWVSAGDIREGDILVGFDEHQDSKWKRRMWKRSVVKRAKVVVEPRCRIFLDNGKTIVCSEDHRWLVKHSDGGSSWVNTKDLRSSGKYHSHISQITDMWSEFRTYTRGYLAAAFDGEGSLYQGKGVPSRGDGMTITLSFTQNRNEMLQAVKGSLTFYGFHFKEYEKEKGRDCFAIKITTRNEILRFLGSIRPKRLLPKFDIDRFGSVRCLRKVHIKKIEKMPPGEVIALTTSTGTFVAEGLASHNSECRWQIIGKLPFPDTRDRLTKARMERDPEYGAYLAMQSLVQASGRGTRAPNDSCVSFLIDDSAFWFMKRFKRFAPRWFMDGYRTSDLIPQVREE